MPDLDDITRRHNLYLDSLVKAFEQHLTVVVGRAQATLLAKLASKLSITDGAIDRTPGNMRTLRGLNVMFARALDKAGYPQLVQAFVNEFMPGSCRS